MNKNKNSVTQGFTQVLNYNHSNFRWVYCTWFACFKHI